MSLVCQHWKELEATVPQHPTSICYNASQPKSRDALRWLIKQEINTCSLQAVDIVCSGNRESAYWECSGRVHALLAILGTKLSPLTCLNISNLQSGHNLGKRIAKLRNLKSLRITSWHYCKGDIPALAQLSNLQHLQVRPLSDVCCHASWDLAAG